METYRAAEWKNAVCVNGVHKKIQIKFLPIPNLWTVVYTVYKLYQLPAKKKRFKRALHSQNKHCFVWQNIVHVLILKYCQEANKIASLAY